MHLHDSRLSPAVYHQDSVSLGMINFGAVLRMSPVTSLLGYVIYAPHHRLCLVAVSYQRVSLVFVFTMAFSFYESAHLFSPESSVFLYARTL
jgi:hypothetical protein